MTVKSNEFVEYELIRLRIHEIPFKRIDVKKASIPLKMGENLICDLYRRTVEYKNKIYKYKYLERFIEQNDLEVSYE